MKVVNYFSSIPVKDRNKVTEKTQILANFAKGVSVSQDECIQHHGDYIPSDVAVIQGWVHANSGNTPHLQLRKKVIRNQIAQGKTVITADSNLFLYKVGKANQPHHYLRYSANDVFPTTGNYFWNDPDPKRWQQISKDLDITVKDWNTKGSYILLCLQRNGGWSMGGLDSIQWCTNTINQLQQYTDRTIIVRAHPGDKKTSERLRLNLTNVKVSTSPNIVEELKKAWATITYNSSPGVASAIEGVPVFVTDPNPQVSQAYDVCNTDLSQIESPKTFDREPWLNKLAMCHWNFAELASGKAWAHMRNYI
jgi:hypothetical protein